MEIAGSSEKLVPYYHIIGRHFIEDGGDLQQKYCFMRTQSYLYLVPLNYFADKY
jgi:hypothetical protein